MRHAWSGNRISNGRVIGTLSLAIMLIPAGSDSIAQTLDISSAIAPPVLVQPTYSAHLVAELDDEIKKLRIAPQDENQQRQAIRTASINIRMIASDLLASGDRAGKDGSIAVLAGLRLARGRGAIDSALSKLLDLPPASQPAETPGAVAGDKAAAGLESILRSIRVFNDSVEALERQAHPFDGHDPDEILPAVFKHLAQAIGELEQSPIASHWIPARSVNIKAPASDRAATISSDRPELSLEAIAARLPDAPLLPQARDDLADIIDFLRRGEQFTELQPRIDQYRSVVQAVLELADLAAQAAWLTDRDRQAYSGRIAHAVALFKDPKTRDAGRSMIGRLNRSRAVIEHIGALAQAKVEVKAIAGALSAAEMMIDDEVQSDAGRQQLALLAQILERMVAYRHLPAANLKGDLRSVERDLHKSYRKAEEALLKQIGSMAANAHPMSDPAFTTLLSDHKQLLADLQRVREVPAWVQAIAAIDHGSSDLFQRQILKISRWLLDPNRRPDAVAAMDQFQQQLNLFAELPFEKQLRAADPTAIAASGGLNEKLIAVISQQRQKWAQAWSEGNSSGEAGNWMMNLYRLTRTMAEADEVVRAAGPPEPPESGIPDSGVPELHIPGLPGLPGVPGGEILNRWPAWQLDPATVARPMADVVNRLKLATAAAVGGDEAGLAQQLERMDRDAPLAKLVGRLSGLLREDLSALPQNEAAAIMGQIVFPAMPGAWMLDHQRELADVCRYAAEQQYAAAAGRKESADAMNQYVNAVANRLLVILGERRGKLPSIGGIEP